LMLFPLLGRAIAERIGVPWVRRAIGGTAVLVIGTVIVVSTQIRLDWMHPMIVAFANHDPDVEGIDWTSLRDELATRDLLKPGVIVGVPNWRDAGKIAYALGPGATVTVLNTDARQFGFVAPASAFAGRDLLVLTVDDPNPARRGLLPWFSTLESLQLASIDDDGISLQSVSVFIGRRLQVPPHHS